jgi:cytochrome b561
MSLRNTTMTYGSVAKFFHWLIFILLAGQVTFGYFLESIPKDIQPITYNLHKLMGVSILLLMLLRGLWALNNPKPYLPLSTKLWEHLLERFVHFLLYALVFAMALVGWIGSIAAGRPPHLGNLLITLPLIPANKEIVEIAFYLHGILAIALIILVGLHVAAALFHYIIKRDNVLQRMLPGA